MAAEEIWKPTHIRGDRYEVSSLGRVRSNWNGSRILKSRPIPNNGHHIVSMQVNGKQRQIYVHQLVAHAFVEGQGPVVRHLDDDFDNNTAANLAFGTQRQNLLDAVKNGRHKAASKTHCIRGHEFKPGSFYSYPDHKRVCKACQQIRTQRYKSKQKEMAA